MSSLCTYETYLSLAENNVLCEAHVANIIEPTNKHELARRLIGRNDVVGGHRGSRVVCVHCLQLDFGNLFGRRLPLEHEQQPELRRRLGGHRRRLARRVRIAGHLSRRGRCRCSHREILVLTVRREPATILINSCIVIFIRAYEMHSFIVLNCYINTHNTRVV